MLRIPLTQTVATGVMTRLLFQDTTHQEHRMLLIVENTQTTGSQERRKQELDLDDSVIQKMVRKGEENMAVLQ